MGAELNALAHILFKQGYTLRAIVLDRPFVVPAHWAPNEWEDCPCDCPHCDTATLIPAHAEPESRPTHWTTDVASVELRHEGSVDDSSTC